MLKEPVPASPAAVAAMAKVIAAVLSAGAPSVRPSPFATVLDTENRWRLGTLQLAV